MRRAGTSHYRRYLPISELDLAWGLHVTCGGYLRMAAGDAYPPTGHPATYDLNWQSGRVLDEFQLHFLTRGGGHFESAEGSQTIAAGMVFLLFPGVWHRYQPDPATGWDEWWIGFSGDQALRMMRPPFFSSRQPVIPVSEPDALLEHFTEIVAIMQADQAQQQRLLSGQAALLLGTLQLRRADTALDARAARLIQEAKRLISAAVAKPINGQAIAAELKVGYHWLRRAFRRQVGMSLHEYHAQLRLHAAMHLLESTDRSIADISHDLGFDDAYYFSRFFRRQVGLAPKHWRRQRAGG